MSVNSVAHEGGVDMCEGVNAFPCKNFVVTRRDDEGKPIFGSGSVSDSGSPPGTGGELRSDGVVVQIETILLPTATTPRGIRFAIPLPSYPRRAVCSP